MSHSLSMDLRVRFKHLMEGGLKAAAAGRVLLLSRATAARWGHKVREGLSLEPLPSGAPVGCGKLAPYMDFFVELITQDPDITLYEMRAALSTAYGVTCTPAAIHKALVRHGYTYKKRLDCTGAPKARRQKSPA